MMGDDDDGLDTYYAIDDDAIRGNKEGYIGHEDFCTTPSFYRLYRPTCNEIHSSVVGYQWLTGDKYASQENRSRYLGSGAYRRVFLLEKQFASDSDQIVFKSMKRLPPGDGNKTLEERAGP